MKGGNELIQHERWHEEKYDYYTIGLNTDFSHPYLLWHRCFEISLVLEGEIMMQYEDQNYTLKAGDMIFVTSNCLHVHKTMISSKILSSWECVMILLMAFWRSVSSIFIVVSDLKMNISMRKLTIENYRV